MEILHAFESIRSVFLTVFESIWSFLGEEAFLAAAIVVIYWCYDKMVARRIMYSFIVAANFTSIIKNLAAVPVPVLREPGFRSAAVFPKGAEQYSFPCMHTCRSAVLSVNIFYNFRQKLVRAAAVLVMIMVPLSRMYLGEASLVDVLVSFIISGLIVLLINRFIDGMVIDRNHYPIFCLLLSVLPLFSFVCFLSQYYNGLIGFSAGVSAVKMAGTSVAVIIAWMFEITFVDFNEKCDHIWKQFVKVGIGLAGIAVLKLGLDALVSLCGAAFWPGIFMEYFIITFGALGLYPMIFKRYFAANY